MASCICRQHTQPSPCTPPSQSPWSPWSTGMEHSPFGPQHSSHLKEASLGLRGTSHIVCIGSPGLRGLVRSPQPGCPLWTWLLQKQGLRTNSRVSPWLLYLPVVGLLLDANTRTICFCCECFENGSRVYIEALREGPLRLSMLATGYTING